MTFRARARYHSAVPCAGLLLTMFLFQASSVAVHGAADVVVGIFECDPTWMEITSKSRTASRCALRIDPATEDLYDMSRFSFAGLAAASEELPLVYTKTKSTKRVLENGGTDTIWEGTDGAFGMATLIQNTNGGLVGSFSTSTSVFTVLPAGDANGMLRIQETYWADAPESGSDDYDDDENAAGRGGGGTSVLSPVATIVVRPQPTQEETTSWGDATIVQSPAEDGSHSRMLRKDRHLQISTLIDVLVLVTDRALCESAGQPLGCPATSSNIAPLEGLLSVAEQQTNRGMQDLGVPVAVRFLQTLYLNPGYDGRPSEESLDTLLMNADVAQWRRDANADLVTMISGESLNGETGGIAKLNSYVSVVSHRAFQFYTLTHELFHNFGASHDRANSGNVFHPYGHGLQVPGYFRTVMAYPCPNNDCPRVFYLSSSGPYNIKGIPIGDATHDNARLVRENAPIVADYSKALTSPPPPPPPPPIRPTSVSCFSQHSEVLVKGKGVTSMDALKIGDSVLTAKEVFSKVYSFGHNDKSSKTKYLQIFAESMHQNHPLEISAEHLIYIQDETKDVPMLVTAGDLRVGDHLLTASGRPTLVLWIREVERLGAYAPLTMSGDLLVNGVLASSYVSRSWLKDYISGLTLHKFQHGAMLPVRFFCSLLDCHAEIYDESTGFSAWVQFWYEIEQWILNLPLAWQAFVLSLLLVPATLIALLGSVVVQPLSSLIAHAVAVIVGYVIWQRQTRKDPVPGNKKY